MKIFVFFLFFTMTILFPAADERVKAITFNIRYGTADDGENSWPNRKNILFNFINTEKADFIGMQEAMIFQIDEIIENCPGYSYIGRTRDADGKSGEATPILYRPAVYEMVEQHSRWLSLTPEIPASKSWDSALPRIFTWAVFRKKADGKEIVIYNTHFDHLGVTARQESARLLVSHIDEHFSGSDLILLGDFNALETSDAIRYFTNNQTCKLSDTYRQLHSRQEEKDMTYYGWNEHLAGSGRRIDYIFYRGNLKPVSAYVSNFHIGKNYPSDHMPVVAVFEH